MLKDELKSIQAALGEVQGHIQDEEMVKLVRGCRRNLAAAADQAEALENNLDVVSVDWGTDEAEIAVPKLGLRLVARNIKVSGILPARAIREVM